MWEITKIRYLPNWNSGHFGCYRLKQIPEETYAMNKTRLVYIIPISFSPSLGLATDLPKTWGAMYYVEPDVTKNPDLQPRNTPRGVGCPFSTFLTNTSAWHTHVWVLYTKHIYSGVDVLTDQWNRGEVQVLIYHVMSLLFHLANQLTTCQLTIKDLCKWWKKNGEGLMLIAKSKCNIKFCNMAMNHRHWRVI